MSVNRLWLVHRPSGMRVLIATKEATGPWHFRHDNEVQREFDQFADAVAAPRGPTNPFTDTDFALELLDPQHAPYCFGVNETPVAE